MFWCGFIIMNNITPNTPLASFFWCHGFPKLSGLGLAIQFNSVQWPYPFVPALVGREDVEHQTVLVQLVRVIARLRTLRTQLRAVPYPGPRLNRLRLLHTSFASKPATKIHLHRAPKQNKTGPWIKRKFVIEKPTPSALSDKFAVRGQSWPLAIVRAGIICGVPTLGHGRSWIWILAGILRYESNQQTLWFSHPNMFYFKILKLPLWGNLSY